MNTTNQIKIHKQPNQVKVSKKDYNNYENELKTRLVKKDTIDKF